MLFACSGCLSERHMNQSEIIHDDDQKIVKIETVAAVASSSVCIQLLNEQQQQQVENTTPDKQKILTLFDSKSSRNRRNIRQVTPTKNNTMGHEPQECLKLVQILYLNVQIAAKIYVGETYQAFVRRVSGFKYEQKCFNFIKFKWP